MTFQDRVKEIIEPELEEIRRLFLDSDENSQDRTLSRLANLASAIKDQVTNIQQALERRDDDDDDRDHVPDDDPDDGNRDDRKYTPDDNNDPVREWLERVRPGNEPGYIAPPSPLQVIPPPGGTLIPFNPGTLFLPGAQLQDVDDGIDRIERLVSLITPQAATDACGSDCQTANPKDVLCSLLEACRLVGDRVCSMQSELYQQGQKTQAALASASGSGGASVDDVEDIVRRYS